jgi:hypothetical protein
VRDVHYRQRPLQVAWRPRPSKHDQGPAISTHIASSTHCIQELTSTILKIATSTNEQSADPSRDPNSNVLACALDSLAELVVVVGSSVQPLFDSAVEAGFAATTHPYRSARVSAAYALRSLSIVQQSRASELANKVC